MSATLLFGYNVESIDGSVVALLRGNDVALDSPLFTAPTSFGAERRCLGGHHVRNFLEKLSNLMIIRAIRQYSLKGNGSGGWPSLFGRSVSLLHVRGGRSSMDHEHDHSVPAEPSPARPAVLAS